MNKEILNALSELEKEKGIRQDVVLEAIKAALETGYKKNFSKATNFSIDIEMPKLLKSKKGEKLCSCYRATSKCHASGK